MALKEHLLENFNYLIENNPDGIVIHSDGIIRYANKSIMTVFGAPTLDGIIGKSVFDFIHPDYHAMAKKRIMKAIKDMEPAPVAEYEGLKLDGSKISIEILSIPFVMAGEPAMQVLVKDISERKRQYKALQASEEKFRALFETAPDAIILSNKQTNIISSNKALKDLFEYEYEDLIGKSWMVLVPKRLRNDRIQKLEHIRLKLRAGEHIKEDLCGLTKSGKEIPIEIKIGSWQVDGESFFTTIIRDISERKNFEEKLRHLADTDYLTGIYNRRTGLMLADQILKTSKRTEQPVTVCYLDLDNFKLVNDSLGHVEGDKVLSSISALIKSNLRESDIFCRLGGDEFMIVWSNTTLKQAKKQWKRILDKFEKWNAENYKASLGISVGFSSPDFQENMSINDLINIADQEMYKDKENK